MKIGDVLTTKVTAIKPYGIFVQLPDGGTGLVHISEIKAGYIDNIADLLKLGQDVEVQVIDIDDYDKKPSLSIRSLTDGGKNINRRHRFSKSYLTYGFRPLGASMKKWIREGKAYLREREESN